MHLEEDDGTLRTLACLDWGVKSQPSTARSSGESESTQADNVTKGLNRQGVTQDEAEMLLRIDDCKDRAKAAATVLSRTVFPIQSLMSFLSKDRLELKLDRLLLDASVAESVSRSGFSRVLSIIRKTQAVDLQYLKDSLNHLQVQPMHVSSSKNNADIFTKAVASKELNEIKKRIGRKSGLRLLFQPRGD